MSLLQIVVVALVQGITEFLPISSSAHLILIPAVTGWSDQGIAIDVAAHVGTLGAVVIYFRRDMAAMLTGLGDLLRGRRSKGARLVGFVIVASIPVLAAGFAIVKLGYAPLLRSPVLLAWGSIIFGVVLYVVDRLGATVRRTEELGWRDVVIIGLAQALALIPGTSRSGITVTAGRFLGMRRDEAARFSMLLAVPTILAAGAYEGLTLYQEGNLAVGRDALLTALLSFVAALATISVLMRWLQRATFTPFVVYRVALGLAILGWVYL